VQTDGGLLGVRPRELVQRRRRSGCELKVNSSGVGVCSVPCNWKVAGSDLPQASADQPWTSCSPIIVSEEGNGKPPHSYHSRACAKAMIPMIMITTIKSMLTVLMMITMTMRKISINDS